MKQNISHSSLNVLKTAKSTLIKTVFLSVSVLTLGSALNSASAAPESQPVKTIHYFMGIGDAVRTTGQQTDPIIYSKVTPVNASNWTITKSEPRYWAYQCEPQKKNCDVKLGDEVKLTPELDELFKKFWAAEKSEEKKLAMINDPEYQRCLAEADKLSGVDRQLARLKCDIEARDRLIGEISKM